LTIDWPGFNIGQKSKNLKFLARLGGQGGQLSWLIQAAFRPLAGFSGPGDRLKVVAWQDITRALALEKSRLRVALGSRSELVSFD
jgi:hypothetical protein